MIRWEMHFTETVIKMNWLENEVRGWIIKAKKWKKLARLS